MSEFEKMRYQKILEALREYGIKCYPGILNDGRDEYIVLEDRSQEQAARDWLEEKGIAFEIKQNGLEPLKSIWITKESVPEELSVPEPEPEVKKQKKKR